MNFHPLLQKQIEECLPEEMRNNAAINCFLSAIDTSYYSYEKNREEKEIALAKPNKNSGVQEGSGEGRREAIFSALERIGDNIWEHDYRKDQTVFSKLAIDMINYNAGDNVKVSDWWMNHIHPDDKHIVVRLDAQYKSGEINEHKEEYRLINNDGKVHWILDRGIMLERAPDGSPLKTLGTHTDITKIKETEEALRESEQSFRSLAENTPGVLYQYHYINKKGSFVYISSNAEKKIGITAEELENFYSILHPDDIEREKKMRKSSIERNTPYSFEGRFIIPGKPLIWLCIASSLSRIQNDGTLVYTGIINNITREKEAELSMQLREEKYRNIIANINLGMMEVNNDNVIDYVNQSFCDMCGYTEEELIGRKADSLFLNQDTQPVMDEKNRLRSEGRSDAYEMAVKNKNGEAKWWLISGAPRYNDAGEMVGTIGIHLDITEQKKMQSDLILARKQAEESAKSKQVFLANMSHEIRTPMNAIIGMSRQLAKTSLTERQRTFLETIHSAADNLLVVVNDVLDLSKMDAGKLTLEKIGFCLKDVIDRAIHVVEHKAEEKGLLLNIEYYDSRITPVQIGDPYRINQVLLNLLSNAVKFTEKGAINLRCHMQSESESSQVIAIEVRDTGIGMEAEFAEKIFEAFQQEYSSVTRKYGGTGLGMHICKQLVEMMDGTIAVQSKKGVGTNISVTIEFLKGESADVQRKEIMPFEARMLKGKKILVADDNDMNRFLISVIFQNYQSIVIEARNGKEAIDILKNETVDVVLMDIQMPVMDGLQATRYIREELKSTVPVIALTANAMKGDHEKYLESGLNSYVLKPFNEDDLIRAIIKQVDDKQNAINMIPEKEPEMKKGEPLYNLSQLIDISRGDENFITQMIGIFIHQAQIFMDEITEEIQGNNLAKVASVAHKFKPSVSNICQPFMYDDIKHIEQMALKGESSDELRLVANQFLKNVSEVILQLQEKLLVVA